MEEEVAIRKVRRTPKGGFIVTIPKQEVANRLKLKGLEKVRVILDAEKRRIIYELIKQVDRL